MTDDRGLGLKGWLSGPTGRNVQPEPKRIPLLDRHRIAVLPLSNISPDPQDEYFADGITEELIASLSKISGLTIISKTSTARYKGSTKSASEVAKELNVGTLVVGSVRKTGIRVRITVQLVDAVNEADLWADSYDKQIDDVFAIQSDVAQQVARALKIHLLGPDRSRLERLPTSNIDAFQLYLKGRYLANRRTEDAFRKAILFHEKAIANDPDFALAFAGLATCYNSLGFFGMIPSSEAGAKTMNYAKKAIEIDDSLAEAHLAMGRAIRNYEWDFQRAESEYKRAIALNPSLAEAYGMIAILMLWKRDFAKAISEIAQMLDLDPLSDVGAHYAGTVFLYSGLYDKAIEQFTKALEIAPDNAFARTGRGLAYVQKAMFEIGVTEMRMVATTKNPPTLTNLAYGFAKSGRQRELDALLNSLLKEAKQNHELAIAVACAYANKGMKDNAFEWLHIAYTDHLAHLPSINRDIVFDCIRSDSRFQELIKQLGYTPSFRAEHTIL